MTVHVIDTVNPIIYVCILQRVPYSISICHYLPLCNTCEHKSLSSSLSFSYNFPAIGTFLLGYSMCLDPSLYLLSCLSPLPILHSLALVLFPFPFSLCQSFYPPSSTPFPSPFSLTFFLAPYLFNLYLSTKVGYMYM